MVPYLWRIEPTAAPRSHVAWWLPETPSLRIEHLNLFLSNAAIDSDKTQESFHYYPPPSQRRVDTVPLKRCLKINGAPSRQGTPFLAKTVEAALSVGGQRPLSVSTPHLDRVLLLRRQTSQTATNGIARMPATGRA